MRVFGGRPVTVTAVVQESVSVLATCSREEDGGSKMGETGSRLGGKVDGIRRGRSARVRAVRVGELFA